MDVLGLADPADYNAPTNSSWAPSTTSTASPPVDTATVQTASGDTPAPAVPADDRTEGPFPPAPPTVSGVDVTQSVYQQGA